MAIDLSQVPTRPGVYLFKSSGDRVIYVGKAKNLRNRLRSYFQSSSKLDARKASMVEEIKDFSFIATGNELEAWILEANLIKQYKPKFNIILRDDKNYPYIRVTVTEEWPRVEVVRKISRDGNIYFGPYIPAQAMWEAIGFIRRNFLIRTCGHALDKPVKPCIQYQMKRCHAPCARKISAKEYMKMVRDIILFLKGEKKGLIERLERKMKRYSSEMRYEEAAQARDSIARLHKAFESQKIIAPELGDIDVIGFYRDGDDGSGEVAINMLFIRNGMMIGAKDFFIDDQLRSGESEMMASFIELFYSKEILPGATILTNILPAGKSSLLSWLKEKKNIKVRFEVPTDGKKLELLDMANENARLHFGARRKVHKEEFMEELAARFNLGKPPKSIGAFDVSTLFGSESVGALIWWEKGEFRKENYRHVRIKWVEGMDDYSMMYETIVRSLRNLEGRVPDLIVIDGGAGQLEIARRALNDAGLNVNIMGVAKKPDRAFLTDGSVIDLEDRNRSSLLLKKVRDEVHRFVITFHRKLRDKRFTESVLEKIPGIGGKRRLELLRHFGSIENIRKATPEEIARIRGFNSKISAAIIEHLKEANSE
ncbi:MAG TPA: excinuclease ABC subunit UvrC [Dissulfurispiraceae bacterium]|nr:excinuclease ABC subunit UvrC [Dissulfurispiraceae bacterium]